MLHRAREREKDANVREQLDLAVARVDLVSKDPAARIAALDLIAASGNDSFLSELRRMTAVGADGKYVEADADVRAAAEKSMSAVVRHQRFVGLMGDFLHGLSLASVLLFAALGLAITFGLLGVINMAHGEMLMLGAYATYAVQTAMHGSSPLPAGRDSGRLPLDGAGRNRPRALGDSPPLRPAARDAARHLGDQPRPHPDDSPHLRGAERLRREP